MQYTLKSITNIDLIGETMKNPTKKWGIQKVIKYPIDYDNFLQTCIKHLFHNLDSTRTDVSKMKTDTFIIAAEEDCWVNYNDYSYVFTENNKILREIYKIPEAGHRLYKTNGATSDAFHHVLQVLIRYFTDREFILDEIKEFENFELAHLNRLECRREKQYRCVHQEMFS